MAYSSLVWYVVICSVDVTGTIFMYHLLYFMSHWMHTSRPSMRQITCFVPYRRNDFMNHMAIKPLTPTKPCPDDVSWKHCGLVSVLSCGVNPSISAFSDSPGRSKICHWFHFFSSWAHDRWLEWFNKIFDSIIWCRFSSWVWKSKKSWDHLKLRPSPSRRAADWRNVHLFILLIQNFFYLIDEVLTRNC